MATTIETVFEKGVFRPLQPVALPENRRVRINIDDPSHNGTDHQPRPHLPPREYAEESYAVSDSEGDYQSVPPKAINTIRANVTFAGKLQPAPYPERD